MTTSILPTKAALQAYTASPAQLKRDAEVELFLQDHYDFLIQLNQTLRNGFTSFDYNTDQYTATTLHTYLTSTNYGYNYTLSAPDEQLDGSYTLTVTWAA